MKTDAQQFVSAFQSHGIKASVETDGDRIAVVARVEAFTQSGFRAAQIAMTNLGEKSFQSVARWAKFLREYVQA